MRHIRGNQKWITCPECRAMCRDRPLSPDQELRCGRCGVSVKRYPDPRSLQRAWALSIAGLILLVLANVQPVLIFDVSGNTQANFVVSGVFNLFSQGYSFVALLVFFCAIAAPAIHLAAACYVLSGCCLGQRLPYVTKALRIVERLEQWNLVPVYAVATLVAVVKLDMLGKVEWQLGAFWLVALALCSLLTARTLDVQLVEDRLERLSA